MNDLGQLAKTGAAKLLRSAADVMTERGLARGVTRDIGSGKVDMMGALALAAGAKVKDIDDRDDLLTTAVPMANRAAAAVAWEALEWASGGDPLAWQDIAQSEQDVILMFRIAASRLDIALI